MADVPVIAISFKAPAPLIERIDRAAQSQLISRSDVIRHALLLAVERGDVEAC